MEPWAPGTTCYVCGRLVAEVSAWQDDDGGQWNAHWDCHQRAELKERARQAGSDESLRSVRGRLGAYTRWANADAQERFAAGYRMRQGMQAKFEREVDPEGKTLTAGASQTGRVCPQGAYAAHGVEVR